MKRGAIFLLVFACLSLVSASYENISLSLPGNASFGSVFQVNLTLINFSLNTYDIKIDITNSSGNRIAKIWSGSIWQSTYNYVTGAINTSEKNDSSFLLNITEIYNGTAQIEVRVRASSSYIFSGYSINVSYENQTTNSTGTNQTNQNTTNSTNQTKKTSPGIYLELNAKESMQNNDELDLEVSAFNLEDRGYDLKICLQKGSDLLSEVYDSDPGKWKSCTYYLLNVFSGPGNTTDTFSLRLKPSYENLTGYFTIEAKLRENGGGVINSTETEIEILEEKLGELVNNQVQENESQENSSQEELTGMVTKDIKSYKSKQEYIKEYSLYGFTILCFLLLILLVIENARKNRSNNNR